MFTVKKVEYTTASSEFLITGAVVRRATISGRTNDTKIDISYNERRIDFPVASIPLLINALQKVYDAVKPADVMEDKLVDYTT